MKNNIQNKELETTHTTPIDLRITDCKIFTALGESATGKQLYANGVMDIDVQLAIEFNRELTEEEKNHFNSWPNICLGYYDDYAHDMVYVHTGPWNETYFIDEPGFFTGMIHNRDKREQMFYQLTLSEKSYMEKEFPDILEAINNNNNYYEAYGNELKENTFYFYTTMRAGPNTQSRDMSFRIIMPNGKELFTYDSGPDNPFAILELTCVTPPSVAPRNSTGISIARDQHILHDDANINACGVVRLDLGYLNTGGAGVDVFAIYSGNTDILQFEQDNFLNASDKFTFWYLPETGYRFNGSAGYLETSPTHLHTLYNWNTKVSGDPESDHCQYGRKSFSIQNPYKICFDPNSRNFYMRTELRDLLKYENIYLFEKNQFGHVVSNSRYPVANVPEFIYQEKYSSNIFITQTTQHAREGRSELMMIPQKDRFSIIYNHMGAEDHAQMPIVVMDRYGTRHNLTLKDVTMYTWEGLDQLSVAMGLSVE